MIRSALTIAMILAVWGASVGAYLQREPRHRTLVLAAFGAHVAAAVFQVLMLWYWFGSGDSLMYLRVTQPLTDEIGIDPSFLWQVVRVILQLPSEIDLDLPGAQSTQSMVGTVALVALFVGHDAPAPFLVFAMFSFWGKVVSFHALRDTFAPRERALAGAMLLLAPSGVFWTSGAVKEAISAATLGPGLLGVVRASRGDYRYVPVALVALATLALYKAYIVFAAGIAFAAYILWSGAIDARGRIQVRVAPALIALVGLTVTVGGVSVIAPQYSLSNVIEEATREQAVGFTDDGGAGGSVYAIGTVDSSIVGLLRNAPLALATGLFRPSLLEASNVLMLANGVETALFLGFAIRAVVVRGPSGIAAAFRHRPSLVFCLVFVLVLGFATGLTSSNLGTLSRYRSPLVPFFCLLLAILNQDGAATEVLGAEPSPDPAPAPRAGPRPFPARPPVTRPLPGAGPAT